MKGYKFGRRICVKSLYKKRKQLLIGCVLSVFYLRYMHQNDICVISMFECDRTSKPDQDRTILIREKNTTWNQSITEKNIAIKFYPDHKQTDYPLSTLPDPYMISNEEACKNISNLKIIVIVTSAVLKFVARRNIRDTWGKLSYYKEGEVRVVFLLGRAPVEFYQNIIYSESKRYHDIVQGNFLDSYKNLTIKTVLGVRWVKEHCPNSKMVVKVDDDVVINLFQILHMIENGECCTHPHQILCHRRPMGDSVIFRSQDNEKWKIDDDYFPSLKTYPFPYCNGFFSLMAPGVIPILYDIATHTPYFWVEDVYLTGIVASQSKQIILSELKGVLPFDYEGIECFEDNGDECVFIAGVTRNTKHFYQVWSYVYRFNRH